MIRGLICFTIAVVFANSAHGQFWGGHPQMTKAQEREFKRQAALREKQQRIFAKKMEKAREHQQQLLAKQQREMQERIDAEILRRRNDPQYAAAQQKKEQIATQQAAVGLAVLGLFLGMSSDTPTFSIDHQSDILDRRRVEQQDSYERAQRDFDAKRSTDAWNNRLSSPDEFGRSK